MTVTRAADRIFLQPAILDQMHDSVIVTDPRGIVTGCNRAAREIYGCTSEELIGQSVAILYREEDREVFLNKVVASVGRTGEFRGVTIGDTGEGIEATAVKRIFEPFYTTKGETGTGLGLWVTKGIVTKQEGLLSVWNSTTPGRTGTIISVFLPYETHQPL